MNQALRAAVVLVIFNRPSTTQIVFERIRQARPRTLIIIADGPRRDRPDEVELCRQARAIAEGVDWPCEVLLDYAEENMGCRIRVASGLDWVFQNVGEAIILEDDCLPDPTFFRFCEQLLDFYRGEERILQISGSNFLFGRHNIVDSYYFSQYPLCWGWATWRRAWQYYDVDLQAWKANRERYLAKFADRREGAFWATGWDNICSGKLDTWDYQWMMAHFDRNGLSIIPKANLVANIGFGADATHTRSRLAAVRPASGSVRFPLQHPSNVVRNVRADELTARRLFYQRSVLGKATEVVKRRVLALTSRMRSSAEASVL
jgi:hypothetical protein